MSLWIVSKKEMEGWVAKMTGDYRVVGPVAIPRDRTGLQLLLAAPGDDHRGPEDSENCQAFPVATVIGKLGHSTPGRSAVHVSHSKHKPVLLIRK